MKAVARLRLALKILPLFIKGKGWYDRVRLGLELLFFVSAATFVWWVMARLFTIPVPVF